MPTWIEPVPVDASAAGSTPSNFRLCFNQTFVLLICTYRKTATLRLVKKSGRWWRTLENALRNGNRLVRVQTNRANNTIFGWAKVVSISEPASVLSFLNPLSKKDLGCEGWTDDRYITEWCDGDRETIVRRIDFTYLPYAVIPDFQYTNENVARAVEEQRAGRLRHKETSLYGKLKLAMKTTPPLYESLRFNGVGSGQFQGEQDLAPRIDSLDHTKRRRTQQTSVVAPGMQLASSD